MVMSRAIVLVLVLVLAVLPASVGAAGDAHGIDSSPEGQKMRLEPGQLPRSGPSVGKGLEQHTITADVVVVGGGSAGTSAAIAAARNNAKTVLIHDRPVLGGNSGSEIKLSMVGACGPRSKDNEPFVVECRESGIVEEYTLDNAASNPHRVAELFSLELYNKIRAEPNIQLLLNTYMVSADVVDGRIVAVHAENQRAQQGYKIIAKQFIDSSGDGRLGAEAGAEFLMGREGPAKYNESLAEGPDNETEGSSLAFVSFDAGSPQPYTPPPWARKFNASEFKYRSVHFFQYGYWWNEVSWPFNTIRDDNTIRDTLYENLFGIWDYIKNSGDIADSQNWALQWFGSVPCKREGRRFVGQYVSTQNDIMRKYKEEPPQLPTLYWDRVAYAGWNFDLHNPKGMFDPSQPPYSAYMPPYMFSTPLRSLISKDVSNLLFAGRLASFSHVVFGSQRVMKTGATMGQAAGTAAAAAVHFGIDAASLTDESKSYVWSIQQQLLRDDAYVIGVLNEDPRDHAPRARISASSEYHDATKSINGSAWNVISGQTRAVVTDLKTATAGGVGVGQGVPGVNRWISDLNGLPAYLQLQWDTPIEIAQVQLIFDTGLHRKLSFSVREGGVGIWGPQPETVANYTLEYSADGSHFEVGCRVEGNFQRRRVHGFPCAPPTVPPSNPPFPRRPAAPEPLLLHALGYAKSCPREPQAAAQVCLPTMRSQQWTWTAAGQLQSLQYPSLCLAYTPALPTQLSLVACSAPGAGAWRHSPVDGTLRPAAQPRACLQYGAALQPHTPAQVRDDGDCATPSPAAASVVWDQIKLDSSGASVVVLLRAGGLCLGTQPNLSLYSSSTGGTAPPRLTAGVLATTLRINVTASVGVQDARIVEVRVYSSDGLAPFPSR
eukprot:m.215299 g.215299  ORF g.215299 m.215299 type:complete len:887 (+) comp22203_c0_seq2:3558-6218(+)